MRDYRVFGKTNQNFFPIQILIMISRLGHLCFMSQLKTFDLIVFTIVR